MLQKTSVLLAPGSPVAGGSVTGTTAGGDVDSAGAGTVGCAAGTDAAVGGAAVEVVDPTVEAFAAGVVATVTTGVVGAGATDEAAVSAAVDEQPASASTSTGTNTTALTSRCRVMLGEPTVARPDRAVRRPRSPATLRPCPVPE